MCVHYTIFIMTIYASILNAWMSMLRRCKNHVWACCGRAMHLENWKSFSSAASLAYNLFIVCSYPFLPQMFTFATSQHTKIHGADTQQWNWQMWLGAQYEIASVPTVSFTLCHSKHKPQWVLKCKKIKSNHPMYKSISYRFLFITFGNGFGCFTFFPSAYFVPYFIWEKMIKMKTERDRKKTNASYRYVHTFCKCCHTENWAIVMDFSVRQREKMKLKWSCALGFIAVDGLCMYVCMCWCKR